MKDNQHVKITAMNRITVGTCRAILLILFVSISGQNKAAIKSLHRTNQEKDTVEKVRQYQNMPIAIDNYEGIPLFIQKADVKEITNDQYYQLIGSTKGSNNYVSFPNVTLTNNTNQVVTGFALLLGNKQTKRVHWVMFNDLSIEPAASYSVRPSDWIQPEKVFRVSEEGKTTKTNRPTADLDSEKIWLPGTIAELILRVGIVEFKEGSKWIIDESKSSW
jgi:hypothetical protein